MSFYSLSVYPSISIHALREERDALLADLGEQGFGISIHALREERDSFPGCPLFSAIISIHALREERDM